MLNFMPIVYIKVGFKGVYITAITPCIPLMQLNMLRHRLMQHFTRVGKNGER